MLEELIVITGDQWQRRRLKLPKGDVQLGDGRKLRPIIGYYKHMMSLSAIDEVTKRSMLDMAGWNHPSTGFVVSASIGDTVEWGPLLHVSMSYPDHDPTWDEIKLVREVFFPSDMDAMIMLPRAGNYVNLHKHCWHIYQCPSPWNIG